MKSSYFYTFAILLSLLFSACHKKPVTSFTTDKETYTDGEYITLTNTSTNAYSYVWIIKGADYETRLTTEDARINIPVAGTYEVTLACYSKNGKSDKVTKTITVTSSAGLYTFYTDDLYNSSIAIYVDNVYKGSITQESSFATCGSAGCVTIPIEAGSHQVRATLVSFSLNNNYTVTGNKNACNLFYVHF